MEDMSNVLTEKRGGGGGGGGVLEIEIERLRGLRLYEEASVSIKKALWFRGEITLPGKKKKDKGGAGIKTSFQKGLKRGS